jgi:NTE family protein
MKNTVPKLGAAFSGGGVRGLAHLGVLQVLEEAGISVDMVAGTSMGGIVAGLYAAGVPLTDGIEFAKKAGIMDFASPDRAWRGLFNHKKMAALLADLLGSQDITFEDLRIPAAVVAADIERGEMVVLNSGPLISALMATSALPLLFSPVYHQGRWLVDGGAINNLPVDVVRQMGADRVLGVSVPSSLALPLEEHQEERGLSPHGLLFFGNHTRDWRLPFLIAEASLGMTARLVTRTRLARYPPDLLLEVDLPDVGILAADKNAEVIEAGRKAAMRRVAELVALKTEPLPPLWWRALAYAARRLCQAWATLWEGQSSLCLEERMMASGTTEGESVSSRPEEVQEWKHSLAKED